MSPHDSTSTPIYGPPTAEGGWSSKTVLQTIVLLALAEVLVLVTVAPTLSLQPILLKYETTQAAWLSASVLIAGAVFSPVLGRLADDYGKKKLILVALGLSILGSLICLFAPTYLVLLIGRFLQGACIAAVPVAVALVRQVFSPKTVALTIALITSGSGLVSAFIPRIFASLIEATDYRAVFWVPVLYTALVAIAIATLIPESPYATRRGFSPIQPLLLGIMIVLVLVPITFAEEWGWGSSRTILMLVGGAIAAGLWAVTSLRSSDPLLDLRLFKDVRLAMMMVIALCGGAMTGTIFLLISFVAATPPELGLGYGLGATPSGVGDFFSVLFVAIFVGGILGGWASGKLFGPVRAIIIGQILGLIGIAVTFISLESTPLFATTIILVGAGSGFANTAMFAAAVSLVRPSVQAVVASSVALMATLSGSVVSVVLFAYLNRNAIVPDMPGVLYTETGMHIAFAVIGCAITAALIAGIVVAIAARRAPVVVAELLEELSPIVGVDSKTTPTPA